MPNPYTIIGLLIIWLASLAGVGYWQNHAGHVAERVTWQQKDIAELVADNKAVHDTEEAHRATEQHSAELLAAISGTYEKRLQDGNKKTADLISGARAGTFRLRDPAIARPPHSGLAGETTTGTGGRDAAGDGGLSARATEFLLGLTGRANDLRDKLTACQAIALADRVTCNGS